MVEGGPIVVDRGLLVAYREKCELQEKLIVNLEAELRECKDSREGYLRQVLKIQKAYADLICSALNRPEPTEKKPWWRFWR